MKYLFLVFIISLSFNISANQDLLNFDPIDRSTHIGNRLYQGVDYAISLIKEAQPQLSERGKSFSSKVIQELSRANLKGAFNQIAIRHCVQTGGGFFVRQDFLPSIFICNDVLNYLNNNPNFSLGITAQTLIHEGAHLAGETDECMTVMFEFAVMKKTSIGIQTQTQKDFYQTRCNFPDNL